MERPRGFKAKSQASLGSISRILLNCSSALLLLAPLAAAAKDKDHRPAFAEPPQITSENGVLEMELTVGPHTIEVGGKEVTTNLYNGLFAPPTRDSATTAVLRGLNITEESRNGSA